ncbi:hypothetical protein [Methanoregula sp.]|uniref:hypothetical protein n=1 Tax=Methanoregula sp. TaxID=2052170 RepID=UPI003569C2C4
MIISADTPQHGTISQAPTGSRTENATILVTPQIILGSGLQNLTGSGLLPVDTATDRVRLEYPALHYTVASVNLTEWEGRQYYEFGIIPLSDPDKEGNVPVWIDAISGEPFSPGQDAVKITAEQAKRIVTTSFRSQKPDTVRVRYRDIPTTPGSWDFFLVKMNTTFLSGSLDPETGQIISFSNRIPAGGQPAAPVISLAEAQRIADQTIAGWNGPISINMSAGTFESQKENGTPVAGRYVFEYDRIILDIPCEGDGFTVTIDPVTGDITGYERRWNNPDNAFSIASEPLVTKREATFAILQKTMEISPESINSVRILSTQLQWKDQHAPGVTPRPGSIPLAWNVAFDDETLRATTPPMTATGWVDAQTGTILGMDYTRGQ